MKLLLGLLFCITSQAQFLPFPGAVNSHGGGGTYTGPGDVVSSPLIWWGLRAYSAAAAGTKAARVCNASDASCADINTLANGDFDLTTVRGAPLNCTDDACTIKTLYDQTGANNCEGSVPCDVTNATIANRPTLKFDCGGGKACAHFNGTSSQLNVVIRHDTSYPQPISGSAVAERTGNFSASGDIFAEVFGSTILFRFSAAPNLAEIRAQGGIIQPAQTDGSPHSMQLVFNGASSVMVIDGASTTGNPGPSGLVGFSTFSIGGAGSEFMAGYLSEIGWWNGAFSSGQQTSLTSNQRAYYAF